MGDARRTVLEAQRVRPAHTVVIGLTMQLVPGLERPLVDLFPALPAAQDVRTGMGG